MKIFFQFLKDQKILVQKFVGDWSTPDYENYVKSSLDKSQINRNELTSYLAMNHNGNSLFSVAEQQGLKPEEIEKVLSDLRDVNLANAIKDVGSLIRIRDFIPNSKFVNVLLATTPISTAASQIYRNKLKESGENYYYCSTLNRVIDIMKIEISENELECLLNNLEFEFLP